MNRTGAPSSPTRVAVFLSGNKKPRYCEALCRNKWCPEADKSDGIRFARPQAARRGKARDGFDESNEFDGVFPFLVSNKKARTEIYGLSK
ncbi:hypothetical protein A3746_35490 [Oleibacter sp. HI0075]|nr:hypothetical protein A3746_35490 [Oleibacter sp. HI0075]